MLIEGASFFDVPEDSDSQFISVGTAELEAVGGSSRPGCLEGPLLKGRGFSCHMAPSEVETSNVTASQGTG